VNADGAKSEEETRMVIHDLRNLLAVILNYSELVAEETSDPVAVRADIHEIKHAAERAIALTEQLPRHPLAGRESKPPAAAS